MLVALVAATATGSGVVSVLAFLLGLAALTFARGLRAGLVGEGLVLVWMAAMMLGWQRSAVAIASEVVTSGLLLSLGAWSA